MHQSTRDLIDKGCEIAHGGERRQCRASEGLGGSLEVDGCGQGHAFHGLLMHGLVLHHIRSAEGGVQLQSWEVTCMPAW